MIDDGVEHGGSSARPLGQPAPGVGTDEADRAANRRRIMLASLLTAPAVMTLRARSAHASTSCVASINPSHHCT